MTPTQRKAMTLARDWIAEHPERRLCSAGTVVAILTRALAEQPAEQEPEGSVCGRCGGLVFDPVLPQPAIPPGWATAYAAFKGAFDTPLARRRDGGEFAQDARRLLREFNDAMLAATTESPQPAKREPLTDEQIHKASTQAGMQEHYMGFHSGFIRFARAIEAAHGIKGDA